MARPFISLDAMAGVQYGKPGKEITAELVDWVDCLSPVLKGPS